MPRNKKLLNQLEGLFAPAPTEAETTPEARFGPPARASGWSWETNARGALTFCSSEAEAVLGFTPAELLGKRLATLLLPVADEGMSPAEMFKQSLSAGQPLVDLEARLKHKDGRTLSVMLNARPTLDEKGKVLGYRGLGALIQSAPPPAPAPPLVRPTTRPITALPPRPATRPGARPGTAPLTVRPETGALPPAPPPPGPRLWGYVDSPAGLIPLNQTPLPDIPSALRLPLRLQDKTLGELSFFDEHGGHAWNDDELALTQAVAEQLALALENMRLFNETRDYLVKQTLLYEVTRTAASATNVTEALQGAAEALARVLPETEVSILLVNDEDRCLRIRASVGFPPEVTDTLVIPLGQGITGWVAQTNQPALVPNVHADPRYIEGAPQVQSEAAVPLALGDRVIGVLNVESARPHAFSDNDVQLLSTLAGTLAAIIVNNNLLEQIEQERQRLALLYDVLRGLAGSIDLETTLNASLAFAPRFGGQHAYILLLGEAPDMDFYRTTLPGLADIPLADRRNLAQQIVRTGLEQWVLENRRTVCLADAPRDPRWVVNPIGLGPTLARSVMAAPLQTQRGSLTGVLGYTHPLPDVFTEDQLPLLESTAAQVAVALENALLFQQVTVQQQHSARLARATQAVSRTLEEPALLRVLANELYAAFAPDAVLLWRWNAGREELTPEVVTLDAEAAAGAVWPSEGKTLAARQRPDLLEVIQARQQHVHVTALGQNLREALLLPLLYGGEVEGVVEIVQTGRAQGLSQADQDLARAILIASASALQTARLYAEQRQTAERLAEVDRLKSQFLANMSHELRTPLNSIIGFSRVILKGIDGPVTDLQAQDLSSINNAGQHLLSLINSVLDMAKIEAGKMELVLDEMVVADAVNTALTTTTALIKDKPILLRAEVAPDLPTLRADSLRFRQVLLNLLSNAAKFSERGEIVVRARVAENAGPASARSAPLRPGRYVEISVSDQGQGIAPEDLSKLFEAFSQVDASPTRKTGGTGLGLSICRQLVDLHGGRIWVESTVGQGSTFYFTVPTFHQPESATPTEAPLPPGPGAPVVLAADDDQRVINLYRRYLEPHGYAIVGVHHSDAIVARAAELQPAVILLDVLMPDKDGWQVLTELRQTEATRALPIIICTLVADPARGLSLGADDYLMKPILEGDLLRAFAKLKLNAKPPLQ